MKAIKEALVALWILPADSKAACRKRLSARLHRIFFMDSVEGQLRGIATACMYRR